MQASFWDRSEQLGIDRLSPAATAEALEKPFAVPGVTFDPAALDSVVAESQQYPYFIQLWGEALWDVARERGVTRLTPATTAAARLAFKHKTTAYYERRYEELEKQELLEAARNVAAAYAPARPALNSPELNAAIRAGLPATIDNTTMLAARTALRRLGYVWKPPGAATYLPGIPSLMTYIREQVDPAGEPPSPLVS